MEKDTAKIRGDSEYYRQLAARSAKLRITRNINCLVELLHEDAKVPTRQNPTDAGYDVYSPYDYKIEPKASFVIPLRIRVKSPLGYFYKIENRSSMLRAGLHIRVGIIDSTYTGELEVKIINDTTKHVTIEKGQRIAQLIFYPQINASMELTEDMPEEKGERGKAGFGSTGK